MDDLIPVILESNDHWWSRDFQRLALVSPSWLGLIRRRLYACPVLRTFRACNLFVRTVRDNPSILSLVKGLNLSPAIPSESMHALMDMDMASLRSILNLEGLQTVTIGGELAVQAERFIQMMSNTRSITSLHIDGSYIQESDTLCCRQPASLEWNENIAFRFTRLQRLKLTGVHLGISVPPLPYALRIFSIILDDVHISHGSLRDLCHESWGSVRNLAVLCKTTQSPDELVRELLECCENLETLQYESSAPGAHGDVFAEDFPLPTLRDLRLYDVDVNPQALAMLSQTCRGLEQLSVLGRAIRLKPEEWADVLSSGALPSLHRLSVAAGANEPPEGFVPWAEAARKLVIDQCLSRKVMLSFDS